MINSVSSAMPSFQTAQVTARTEQDTRGGEVREAARAPAKTAIGVQAELSEAELRAVQELKKIDRAVRAHEMAHVAAAAGLVTGGPTYSYTTGPDGQRYAIGGEVQIDTSPGSTEEETIAKASAIIAAALAPADPSAQDRSVAAMASNMAAQARVELAMREREENVEEAAKADETQTSLSPEDTTTARADDNRAPFAPFAGDRARARYDDITALIVPQQANRINAFA